MDSIGLHRDGNPTIHGNLGKIFNMSFESFINGFRSYLILERSLSKHSVEAYVSDTIKFTGFIAREKPSISLSQITVKEIREFVKSLHEMGLSESSQARIISGIRVFHEYLMEENLRDNNPLDQIDSPRLVRPIPEVLSPEEMIQMMNAVDLSRREGVRNRAILELMYSCGMRVSELTDFRISCIHREESYVRIIGKGNKERLVPVGGIALEWISRYLVELRNHQVVATGFDDILFLNLRGKKLSRMSIFNFIRSVVLNAGIKKHVSPHSFRHAFATHLVEAGADLRAVQEMLGHASITTTEIYTHLDRERLRDEILTYHPRYYKPR